MADRFKTWKGGGCGAKKIKEKHLDGILLMERGGEWPLQVVTQSLLGGFGYAGDSEDSKACVIPIHAGVPWSIKSDSGDPAWMTPKEFGVRVQARKKAFQQKGGPGVPVSTSLLANYLGTQEEAAKALEDAATLVLQAHVSSNGSMTVSSNAPVLFHRRDLDKFEKMLVLGKISTLAQKKPDFWSTSQRQKHRDACQQRGCSKKGPMTGADLEDHRDASQQGGSSKKGPMCYTMTVGSCARVELSELFCCGRADVLCADGGV